MSPPDVIQEWEETDKSVAFSELHALALADMDGDGLKDIIAGKRWWSHGDNYGSPDAYGSACRVLVQVGSQARWAGGVRPAPDQQQLGGGYPDCGRRHEWRWEAGHSYLDPKGRLHFLQ